MPHTAPPRRGGSQRPSGSRHRGVLFIRLTRRQLRVIVAYLPAQLPRIAVAQMIDPAIDAGIQFGEADMPRLVVVKALAQAAAEVDDVTPLNVAVVGVDDPAQPRNARPRGCHLRLRLMDRQPQPRQPIDDRSLPRPQLTLFVLTHRLTGAALDFQVALFDAHVRQGNARLQQLQAADAHLNKLRLYLRLANEWQWLSAGQYQHVSRMVAEVGRLLGGWLKQARGGK